MKDYQVLKAAAEILQRKVGIVVHGGMGIPITKEIAHAMLTAGIMAQTAETLSDFAKAFEAGANERGNAYAFTADESERRMKEETPVDMK